MAIEPSPFSDIHVLLIDDQRLTERMLSRMLTGPESKGLLLDYVQNPELAEKRVQEKPPHVILLDLMMPVLDGFDLLQRFRSQPNTRKIPIVILSVNEEAIQKARAFSLGANDYLIKLPDRMEMLARLRYHGTAYQAHLDHKRASRDLVDREFHLRSVLENALDAIITINHLGCIIDFNPAAEKLFGYSHKEMLGQKMDTFILSEDFWNAHIHMVAEYAKNSQTIPELGKRWEVGGLRVNGRRIELDMSIVSTMRLGKLHFTAFVQDVTDRKQLLRSLEETLHVAESANRAKSEFLANMSHEIRSPMNAIMGMTELVLGTSLQEDQRDNLDIVYRSSQSLLELINNLLDFSKIQAKQVVLEQIEFDLRGRLEGACENLAVGVHAKELELYCHIAKNVPETLIGDPTRLVQVIINLINNATKFTEEGEIIVKVVRVFKDQTPEWLAEEASKEVLLDFSVSDTGIGIPEDRLDKIFERFTQVDGSTTRKYGGTGLGLAICKQLVELMKGNIYIESQEHQGTLFRFSTLFKVGNRSSSTVSFKEERGGYPEKKSLSGVRVALAHNSMTAQTIITEMLEFFGAYVLQIKDGPTLQRMLNPLDGIHSFDVLLIDHILLSDRFNLEGAAQTMYPVKSILLMPTQLRLEHLPEASFFPGITTLKKPIRLFKLRQSINLVLGKAPPKKIETDKKFPSLSLHILVVDDLEDNRKLAKGILEKAGHTVTLCNSGQEALDVLKTLQCDMIVMDILMPDMDGYETTSRIRMNKESPHANIPIIAVTAQIQAGERDRCFEVGINGVVGKPYRSEELLRRIQLFAKKNKEISNVHEAFSGDCPEMLTFLEGLLSRKNVFGAIKESRKIKDLADNLELKRAKVLAIRLRGQIEQKQWQEVNKIFDQLKVQFYSVKHGI